MINALKSKEEGEDFLNNIPDHVALQLQNDNFKMRSNINSIKEGFREIKNDLENKLQALEMKQQLNFETIRKIIEQGGTKKVNAGLRKYLDGEEIDLNNVHEDYPEYLKNLPALIDKKIKENDEKKREEQNKILNDEMNKKYDMMDYKYGYANSFYTNKNNYMQNNNNPNNNNQNFVISKNYGRFQYIPNNSKKKAYNTFRQNAEQNLKIIKEKEKSIPGMYAYGVGSKNMDSYIPLKMNGCYDDWHKSKKKLKDGEEFEVLESGSEVGINAIKKRVNSKSVKSGSKSEKSKKSKKSKKPKKKTEESVSVSKTKSKSSKASKSKKEKSESSSKKRKKYKKNKKKKQSTSGEKDSNEEDEDKNEESEKKDSDSEGKDDKDSDEEKDSSNKNDSEKEEDEDKDSNDENNESSGKKGSSDENNDSRDNKGSSDENNNSSGDKDSNGDEDNNDDDEDS